jgi:hypothetical protein
MFIIGSREQANICSSVLGLLRGAVLLHNNHSAFRLATKVMMWCWKEIMNTTGGIHVK